jgi:hypothetical protein
MEEYFRDQISGNILFEDLLNNKFDLAWLTNATKKIYSKMISEECEDDGSVKYIYNSDFFRCDDFINNHKGMHILFSGCSETEGVGGNIEDAWSKILYEKINKEIKCSGFFNLSRAGWGWNRIVLNCLIYFEKYGYPEFLFILLPNSQRKFDYSMNGHVGDNGNPIGKWKYLQKYPKYYWENSNITDILRSEPKEYNEDFLNFLMLWKLFNKICDQNSVKLIFSTWDGLEDENIRQSRLFNNFITVVNSDETEYIKQFYEKNKKQKTDITKRDGHKGRITHFIWSEKFYNKYREEKDKNEKIIKTY